MPSAGDGEARQAEVVPPPLDQHGDELGGQGAVEQGDVFGDELLLEVDGVGGDDHACPSADRSVDGREEVGETLPHARPGLDHEVSPGGEGFFDGLGHGQLLGAVLVAGEFAGDGALGPQDFRSPSTLLRVVRLSNHVHRDAPRVLVLRSEEASLRGEAVSEAASSVRLRWGPSAALTTTRVMSSWRGAGPMKAMVSW